MMPSWLHVCNGLARPADESMLSRDIGTTGHLLRIACGGIKHAIKNKTSPAIAGRGKIVKTHAEQKPIKANNRIS